MKRILSFFIVVAMLFSMNTAAFAVTGEPASSPPPYGVIQDSKSSGNGIANDLEEPSQSNDNGIANDIESESVTCSHEETKKIFYDIEYEKYNSEKHSYEEEYEVVCRNCGEILSSRCIEKGKEKHNFKKGECIDCGYIAKNCKHNETKEVVLYWRTDEDEKGNDKSFTLVDVICSICDVKVIERTYYGPIVAVSNDSWCNHDELETIVEDEYYEPAGEKVHYKTQKCKVKCEECGKVLKEYKVEEKEEHNTQNSKCTKCIYEEKTLSAEKEKQNQTNQKVSKKQSKSDKIEESIEPIEWIYIDANNKKFAVNGETINWQEAPIQDPNGNLQVPLRQLAQIMGWKVEWDDEKKHAVVTDGETIKTFMQGFDVYQIKEGEDIHYKNLQNKVTNQNGVLYVDLDGVLENTGYSYYVDGTSYHIRSVKEVIEKVAINNIYGNYNVVASKAIVDDVNTVVEIAKDEVLMSLVPVGDSYFYTIMVPAANQSLKGNYYDGDVTWEGVIGEIIVGELPGVGTVADLRDVFADIKNWEWTWAHAGQTALDAIGLIPIIGALKYSDEFVSVARKTGKVLDAGDVTVAQKLLKETGNIDDVSKGVLKNLDDYNDVANRIGKNSDEIADATVNVTKKVSKASSKKLGENLVAAGFKRPNYKHAAHHIVAGRDSGAAKSREILEKFGIDINDAANGVFLPNEKNVSKAIYHPMLNTNKYNDNVYEMLSKAKTREEAIGILDKIRNKLLDGTFDY